MISKIGFLLFIIGAAGMDTPNITVPVIMIAIGLGILVASSLKENRSCNSRPKQRRTYKTTKLCYFYAQSSIVGKENQVEKL